MEHKKTIVCLSLTAALTLVFHFVPAEGVLRFLLYLALYLYVGFDVLKEAVCDIREGNVFGETFLMSVATIGALVLGLAYTSDYTEAVAVMLFYRLGELLGDIAVDKSRDGISALADIRPEYANVMREGKLTRLSPKELALGDIITVLAGEKIPLDGVIVSGEATLNTSALTGESLPRDVFVGDEVASGCVSTGGVIEVRVTREYKDSTVERILALAEGEGGRKSRAESFITKFARIYTPAVCIGAILIAVIPPLLGAEPGVWIYRALSFLVASCPCALVISIPLCFFAGIGGASRSGILIKGPTVLEALSRARSVAFDKTGTLTKGVFEVTQITAASRSTKERVLEYAALAESTSTHPIAKSIVRAYGKAADLRRAESFKEHGSLGVTASIDGISVAVGGARLMRKLCIDCPDGADVYVAADGELIGRISVADTVKDTSAAAVAELRHVGVRHVAMLTGDGKEAAEAAGKALGISDIRARLMPEGKVDAVEKLRPDKGTVVFVGDGINDTPVLAAADVGVAMGALGSAAAMDAADAVLMDDNVRKLPTAIRIARKCMRIVFQNTVFAIVIKLAVLLLSALGLANMWMAVFADVGVTLIAVANAVRAYTIK